MSIQIHDLVLYSHDGRVRKLPFTPGEVNVITGASKTGKSALISIVDFCMGSGKCKVPYGIIRSAVSWFGLRLKLDDGEAFIARKAPRLDGDYSEECYVVIGREIAIPAFEDLISNTNKDGLISVVTGWTGVKENIHVPDPGHTRLPVAATVRHALMLCFQPQYVINQPEQLFYKANDSFKAQALKDTLPFFLGAVSDDYVANQERLRMLKGELRSIERKLNELRSIRGEGIGKAASLLAQAREAGLSQAPDTSDWNELVAHLHKASQASVSVLDAKGTDAGEYEKLASERERLLAERGHLQAQLSAIQSIADAEVGFTSEAKEQKARLVSIGLLSQGEAHVCPLCEQGLADTSNLPIATSITDSISKVADQLNRVQRNLPQVEKSIAETQSKISGLNESLRKNRESMAAVVQADEKLKQLRDDVSLRALILGRISLYLESLPDLPNTLELERQSKLLQFEVAELEEKLSDEDIKERLESIVSILAEDMSIWAKRLELEHSKYPLRLNVNKLTVFAATSNGAITMDKMGSGENWVGYHLIGHLALHKWFTMQRRPVPHFLFLDQPSQVYFPPDVSRDNVVELKGDDREDLKRMFKLIYDLVQEVAPGLQVIMTEHAEFQEKWYQDTVRERWRGGLKLVPEDWPTL